MQIMFDVDEVCVVRNKETKDVVAVFADKESAKGYFVRMRTPGSFELVIGNRAPGEPKINSQRAIKKKIEKYEPFFNKSFICIKCGKPPTRGETVSHYWTTCDSCSNVLFD